MQGFRGRGKGRRNSDKYHREINRQGENEMHILRSGDEERKKQVTVNYK